MRPLARWTIGPVQPDGYESLMLSIKAFTNIYDVEVVICYNCPSENLPSPISKYRLIDQREYLESCPVPPKGVAWKLYPPRLTADRQEILIDNDLIVEKPIPQIDYFLNNDCTLLLEDHARCYGKFERHVPPGYRINSGLFGMPPQFDFQKYIDFYAGKEWEENAIYENQKSRTFDEQGIVAIALLSYHTSVIIPANEITNCEHHLINGNGYHFIGLNRRDFHKPYRLYKSRSIKLYL